MKVHCLTLATPTLLSAWQLRKQVFYKNMKFYFKLLLQIWIVTDNTDNHLSTVTQLLAQNDTVILFLFLVHRTETTIAISPLKALCSSARSPDWCFYSTTR